MPVPFYLDKARGEVIDPYKKFFAPNHIGDLRSNIDHHRAINDWRFYNNMESIRNSQPAPPAQRPASWKDNIDYSKGYDSNIEDKFRAEHDYLGLADYLSRFRMGTIQEQRAYENEISQIRRYGREYNAIHGHASKEQSDAISFLESYDSGNIDTVDDTNPIKGQYNNAVNSLGRHVVTTGLFGEQLEVPEIGDEEASTISVSFNNKHVSYGLWGWSYDWLAKDSDEHQFNKFVQDTGYGLSDIKAILGDNAVSNKDGRLVINIPKSNIQGIKLLTQIRKWCNETGRTADDVQYSSYGPDNNLISDNTAGIGAQIQGLSDFLDGVNRSKEEVMQAIGGQEIVSSTTVLPYMNERQMNLNRMRQAGMLDDAKFSSALKADNEVYENLIGAAAFSQYRIYTDMGNELGDENLREMTDNKERGALKDYIRNAIRENRVQWNAAISNGEYGTYLVIRPEDNKGDLITEGDDARRGATIFIPGMFTESIQNAFNASTQGKTVSEFNSMQQYGYERTLQNGNIISNVGNQTARLYDKNSNSYREISREEAQNMLHQDIIVEDAARNIRNRAFNLDGTPRVGYDPSIDAKKIAIAAVNELYPSLPIEEMDIAAWNPSKEDIAKRKAAGNVDKDYKAQQAYNIYSELMENIYKLLNVNNNK